MSGHGILKYFRPITHKMYAPEDEDPPEGKDLSYPIYLGYSYISKVILSSPWSIASRIKRQRNQGAETNETFFY